MIEIPTHTHSIVVMGSFNPAIFQPLWFSNNNLIRKEEADEAEIEFIHRSVAVFRTEWFVLTVTLEKLAIESSDPTKAWPLRDLVAGTLTVLEHTPLVAFGLNCTQNFQMESSDKWHGFGRFVAPRKHWDAILDEPGLLRLTMSGRRKGSEGRILVRIEPTPAVDNWVTISVNEHHDLPKDESIEVRNRQFLTILQEQWENCVEYSSRVKSHLLSEFEKQARRRR